MPPRQRGRGGGPREFQENLERGAKELKDPQERPVVWGRLILGILLVRNNKIRGKGIISYKTKMLLIMQVIGEMTSLQLKTGIMTSIQALYQTPRSSRQVEAQPRQWESQLMVQYLILLL